MVLSLLVPRNKQYWRKGGLRSESRFRPDYTEMLHVPKLEQQADLDALELVIMGHLRDRSLSRKIFGCLSHSITDSLRATDQRKNDDYPICNAQRR